MSDYPIPQASMERLKASYLQFEQLAMVISEAMGLGPGLTARLDLQRGVFVVDDGTPPERVNGVAEATANA